MDDLIRRQDAVNELREYITESSISDDESEIIGYNDGIELAISVLSTLPSAQQWIPCSERLPDDGETVLVTRDDGTCKIATFEVGEIENGWQMDSWYTEDNVTAWMPLPNCNKMPLPEPYKGGEKCD